MEPAVERREHPVHVHTGVKVGHMPQWSPPLKGGSTGLVATATRKHPGRNGARR